MKEDIKSESEILLECNKLAKYLNVHPFCYYDDTLVELYRKPDPISSSHIEWVPGTKKLMVNIKYFTDKYPYSEWEINEVSEAYFPNALRMLFTRLKTDAIQKAKSEIPDLILEHLAEEKVETILEEK